MCRMPTGRSNGGLKCETQLALPAVIPFVIRCCVWPFRRREVFVAHDNGTSPVLAEPILTCWPTFKLIHGGSRALEPAPVGTTLHNTRYAIQDAEKYQQGSGENWAEVALQNLRYQIRGSKQHNKRRGELSPGRGLEAVPGMLCVLFDAKFYDSGDLEVDSLEVEGWGYMNTSELPAFVTIYQYIPTLLLLLIRY